MYVDLSLEEREICTLFVQQCDSISPAPREFRPLTRRLRGDRHRMRIWTRWFGAEWMILALLSGMREHASQFRAGQAEFAFGMSVSTLIAEFTRRECTIIRRKIRNS